MSFPWTARQDHPDLDSIAIQYLLLFCLTLLEPERSKTRPCLNLKNIFDGAFNIVDEGACLTFLCILKTNQMVEMTDERAKRLRGAKEANCRSGRMILGAPETVLARFFSGVIET